MSKNEIAFSIELVNEFLSGYDVDEEDLLESLSILAFYLSTLEIYASKIAKRNASAETLRQYKLGLIRGCRNFTEHPQKAQEP